MVFGPAVLFCLAALALLLAAYFFGWQRSELLAGAALTGAVVTTLATRLLQVQARQHEVGQQNLVNIEVQVASLVQSAMDPIITVDEEQRIVLFNKAAETVFRWPRDAVLGQKLEILMPERFRATHHQHVQHFGATGSTSRRMGGNVVLKALRADGEEFPIEASISHHNEGGKKLFTVILRDITQRVHGEESLAKSEATLRGILDSAMDAIITVDERQHIVLFNQTAETVFGCPRDEAIGAPLAWFIPERFRPAHGDHIRRFGETGTSSRRMSVQRVVAGLRRNGEEFPIEASISQIAEHGEKFYTVILRDVTERVRAEQALLHSQTELQEMALAAHSVREQEKTLIARELHDELGQALTALKIDLAWMKARSFEAPVGEKLDAMESMLNRTITATRRISTELRPLLLDDLGLMAALDWLTQNFTERTGVECTLSIGDPEPELHDPHASAVFRIVQESLTNIAKHAKATKVDVGVRQNDSTLAITVQDNGVGFDANQPRKQNSFGLLGLRERAYLLGGEAIIESASGKGCMIEVRIPVQTGESV